MDEDSKEIKYSQNPSFMKRLKTPSYDASTSEAERTALTIDIMRLIIDFLPSGKEILFLV